MWSVLLQVVGVLLVVLGLVFALRAVVNLRDDLFQGVRLQVWDSLVEQWRLFNGPKTVVGSGDVALSGFGTVTATGEVHNAMVLTRPGSYGAPIEQWLAYFEQQVMAADGKIAAVDHREVQHFHATNQAIENLRGEHAEKVGALQDRMDRAIAGRDGRGLRNASTGLAITIVGTALWGLGGLIG